MIRMGHENSGSYLDASKTQLWTPFVACVKFYAFRAYSLRGFVGDAGAPYPYRPLIRIAQ